MLLISKLTKQTHLQVSMKMAEGGADYDALMKKMDKLQTAIDAIEGWELDRQLERAMQALRCPPGMRIPPLPSLFILFTPCLPTRPSTSPFTM